MSGIIGTNVGITQIKIAIDDRISVPWFRDDFYMRFRGRYSMLWPSSQRIMPSSTEVMDKNFGGSDWGFFTLNTKGTQQDKMIIGVTKDSTGIPVGGAIVDLFNTATDIKVATVTSEPDGAFSIGDPNAVACYIVAYKAGSPDVAGTTVNTLIGI